jgi:di/tricarboxylate transporter
MGEVLDGFSDSNVVLIAALFVIGDGLVRTGVARRLGDWLTSMGNGSEIRLIALLMLVVCGLGSMMSSTAVTAIFIPVVLRISHSMGLPASRLMMPLSFAALISGMMTLVATAPNLVVNSALMRQGERGFQFFSFTPFGLPILGLGILYMILVRRWLSDANESHADGVGRPTLRDWVKEYNLAGREFRVRVTSHSPFLGKSLGELRLSERSGARLVAIERFGKVIQPTAKTMLYAGDILLVDLFSPEIDVDELKQKYSLELMPLSGVYFTDLSQEIGMAEVIVPATSQFIDKTVTEVEFRDRYGLTVIGLRRGRAALEHGVQDEKLQLGDTLLMIGPWKAIRNLSSSREDSVLLNLPAELDEVLPVAGKAPHAVLCLTLVVVLMVTGVVPNVQAALLGCLLMGALRVTNMASAYRSIDWKTLVLIVGMMPFSSALKRTGGVDLMANGLLALTAEAGPYGVLAVLFLITASLGLFISNTATAVLMAPVALVLAKDLHASPYPFAMIVALAASTAFVTPVSSPVNTLVVTPGNYTFGDFVRVGAPFAVIAMVVSVVLVPWLLPL